MSNFYPSSSAEMAALFQSWQQPTSQPFASPDPRHQARLPRDQGRLPSEFLSRSPQQDYHRPAVQYTETRTRPASRRSTVSLEDISRKLDRIEARQLDLENKLKENRRHSAEEMQDIKESLRNFSSWTKSFSVTLLGTTEEGARVASPTTTSQNPPRHLYNYQQPTSSQTPKAGFAPVQDGEQLPHDFGMSGEGLTMVAYSPTANN